MATVLVGQGDVVRLLLTGLLSGGHMLVIGVPGLAKTLMVKGLADLLQTAGADPVGALFVFLNLLERHPDRGGEIGLAHVERDAPHPAAGPKRPG